MTPEQKELLLKDLCSRLPYGIKFLRESWNYEWDQELSIIEVLENIDKDGYINNSKVYKIEDIKPFLRPMSSMTKEELYEVQGILGKGVEIRESFLLSVYSSINSFTYLELQAVFDWFNSHHFDYRGLIEQGLAIEVTEENNPYKN